LFTPSSININTNENIPTNDSTQDSTNERPIRERTKDKNKLNNMINYSNDSINNISHDTSNNTSNDISNYNSDDSNHEHSNNQIIENIIERAKDRNNSSNINERIRNYQKPTRKTQRRIDQFYSNRNKQREKEDEQIHFGDSLPPEKHGANRFVSANINGLSARDDFSKLHVIGQSADAMQIDYLGLIETNLDFGYKNIKEKCNSITRNYFKRTHIVQASSDITFNKAYQPGGIMSIMGFPLATCCTSKVDDSSMGRWTEITVRGKRNRKVTIITAYVVCPQSQSEISSKKTTAFTQQWHIIKRNSPGITDIDPRKKMWEDLSTRIQKLKDIGHELIVMMDANDSLKQFNSSLSDFVRKCELIDIIAERHGTEDEPPTYSRGSQRIDYIFTTPLLSEYTVACGIFPLHELCFSDHRAIYADIDIRGFLQGNPSDITTSTSRGIHSKDPRSVKKFQESMEKVLNESDIETKIAEIRAELNKPNIDMKNITTKLEDIDVQFTAFKLECERKSANNHRLPWSPKLRDANHTRMFWSLWLSQSRSKGKRNFHEIRMRYVNDDTREFSNLKDIDRKIIYHQLKRAYRNLQDIKTQASQLREEFLEEQAKMAIDGGDEELHTIIMAIKKAEARRSTFAKLKRLKCNTISHGIDHIIIENSEGEKVIVNDPEDMITALLNQNEMHFSQSDGTPFTVEPLKSMLGSNGTSTWAQALLNGEIDVDSLGLEEAVDSILKQLQRRINKEDIDIEITTDDFIKGYSKWSEYTSTSPSGTHLGLDKAILRYRKSQSKTAEESSAIPLFERYFSIKAFLVDSALRTGHTYNRWTKVINALIEKLPGTPLIHKLRVIHLIESDFNLMIGILWGRRMMRAGEDSQAFNEGQGGSRPGRRTQELLLTKHLHYAILRLSRQNGSSFDNDAKSCFDRIVMPVASLAAQQLGMPTKACEVFLSTLSKIKYHVKTAYGISERSYSSNDKRTIHGPGQGGRGSPAIWVAISSLIMHCLQGKTNGFTITNPYDKSDKFTHWMTGFVDDVTHWCSHCDSQYEEQAVRDLQETAQWWERLLHATGGKLELSKCFFYIIQWEFDVEGVPKMKSPEDFNSQVMLFSSENEEGVIIPQKPCSESHKTLGVMECPEGCNSDEYNRLANKSNALVQRVLTKKLTKYESKLYYSTTYIPSITYGSAIGSFTIKEWYKIESPAVQHLISSMGFAKSIPTEIKFGPRHLGGIGLRHLFVEQGTEKCMCIIRYLRSERPVSNVLRYYLNWCQRIAGTSESILMDTETSLPHLSEEKWMSTLREFLSVSQLQITINDMSPKMYQRFNDEYIMDAAIRLKFKKNQLQQINRCRLYLRCTTISDICNANGTEVTDDAIECNNEAIIICDNSWPCQTRPGPNHRTTWKTFIRCLCKSTPLKSKRVSRVLEQPLGHWLENVQIRRKKSDYVFIDPVKNDVYIRHEQSWSKGNICQQRKYWTYHNLIGVEEIESATSLIPAEVVNESKQRINWSQRCNVKTRNDSIYKESDWEIYKKSIPIWEKHVLQNIEFMDDEEKILEILSNEECTIYCVSDGGVEGSLGSYGWVISNGDCILVSGKGSTPGHPMSSQRAESCGKLSWLTWIVHFSEFHKTQIKCTIQSYCDNSSVVSKSKRENNFANPSYTTTSNFDIFKSIYIQQERLNTPNLKNTEWVKGHQDNTKSVENLSLEARLNIQADTLASEALRFLIAQEWSVPDIQFPAAIVSLVCDGKIQSSNEVHKLRWRYSEFELQRYYEKRLKVNSKQLHRLNWTGLRIARNKLSISEQDFSIKHVIGWTPVGCKIRQYGEQETNCPLCNVTCETIDHLWQCASREQKNRDTIEELREFLRSIHTDPYITLSIIHHTANWLRIRNIDVEALNLPNLYIQAVKEQHEVGWEYLIRGLLINEWAVIQEYYSLRNNITTLGDSWSASVSAWFIKQSRKIWIQRNEKTYSTEQANKSRLEKETFAQVRKLYETSEMLSANDRELFVTPIEDFIQQPWHILNTWVNTAWPTVRECLKAQTERILNHQPRITEYFSLLSSEIGDPHDEQDSISAESQDTNENTRSTSECDNSRQSIDLIHSIISTGNHEKQPHQTTRSRIPLPESEI
jgi:hypothetical protein